MPRYYLPRPDQTGWIDVATGQPRQPQSGVFLQQDPATGLWVDVLDTGPLGMGDVGFAALMGTLMLSAGVGGGLALGGAAPAVAGAEAGAVGTEAGTTGLALVPEFEGGTFGALPASTFTAGGGLTAPQALQGISLANSLARTAQHPSGGNVGGFVGGLAGAATGVPGLSTVGGLVGRQAGNTIDPQTGVTMPTDADITGPDGQIDWGRLATALLGLGGAGFSLAGAQGTAGQQQTLYTQQQTAYQQLLQLFQTYMQQNQQFNAQQQQAFQAALQNYQTITQEVAEDRQRQATAFGEAQGIGTRLADPAQVMTGAQQLYQPLSQNVRAFIGRDVAGQLAQQGATQGGGAESIYAQAFAPYEVQLWQRALQDYLQSQGMALGAYEYAPQGRTTPYGPTPPQPAYAGGQYPFVPTYIPGTNVAGGQNTALSTGLAGIGPAMQGLFQALGFSPNQGQQLAAALKQYGLQPPPSNPAIGTGLSTDPFAPSNNPYTLQPSDYGDIGGQAGLSTTDLTTLTDQGYDPSLFAIGL